LSPAALQASFIFLLPEIILVILAGLILLLDILWRGRESSGLGWFTAFGLAVTALVSIFVTRPLETPQLIFGGMLRLDWGIYVFRLVFLFGGFITVLIATDRPSANYGEFCALLVFAIVGMDLMASSANLVMLYLAIEMTSLPLYILAGVRVLDQKSVEAGIKYLLYGAMASAVMLYGFSLLWGFTGSANLYDIAKVFQGAGFSSAGLVGAALLVTVGFGFKVSAVPFHFWAPDVYEGAPTPVAGFLSTASKAAGFAVLMRFFLAVFPGVTSFWMPLVGLLATASMIVGNFLALTQRNLKRLLAYSSIAQAGYMLVGLAANNEFGFSGVVYYLTSYLVTNLAAFGIVWMVGRETGSDDLDAYAGLGTRNPVMALAMLAALLSLGGIPPLSGFFGKLLVFGAAVKAGLQGQAWLIGLAFVGVLTSVVGLYYYLNVMKILYKPGSSEQALAITPAWRAALVLCIALMFVLGIIFAPWYGWSSAAAAGFLP
jgi:NADH-quinone oxidoreductase subunit N